MQKADRQRVGAATAGRQSIRMLDLGPCGEMVMRRGTAVEGKKGLEDVKLRYATDTGWPSQLEGRLKRRIGALVRESSAFKVGITNWPERRRRDYERDHPRHFSEMIVLYETSNRRNASQLESQLIEHNWDRYELKNEVGGGGGRHGEGWYYLYVVRRRGAQR